MAQLAPPQLPTRVVAAVAERRSRTARRRRRRRHVVLWMLLAVLVGAGAFAGGLLAAPIDYGFEPLPPQAVLLVDSSGRVFGTIRAPQDEEPVPSKDIPQVLKNAVVAAEDERFFAHRGVDPLAVVRALWRDISGAHLQGGSTITQQYVKNVYTGSQRTALRKLREASLAVRLEQHLSKDAILTRYLNTLYLGNGAAGVQAASKYYFGVPVQRFDVDPATGRHDPSLALARAATLAGFIPAPSVWNPVNDPKESYRREFYVLNQMIKNGMITSQQAAAAVRGGLPKIVAESKPDAPTVAPEFRDYVTDQLRGTLAFDDATLFDSGQVKVRTTLDLDLQKAAVRAMQQVLPSRGDPEAALVAVDPRTGDIRALTTKQVGGYRKGGFDLATGAYRSTGSTIKPFTLAVALQHGHTLDEPHSAPQCIDHPFHVCNAESGGSYQTLRSALISSINTVYAPLAVQVGLKRVIQFARSAGLQTNFIDRRCGGLCPAQSLGIPVTPMSEAAAYGTFVDGGLRHTPRSVLRVHSDSQGDLFSAPAHPRGDRVMPAHVANEVKGVLQSVVDVGTGTAARQPFPVYGKTGTTDDFTNAWFTGCSDTLCIAVWMGYDKEYLDHGRVAHSMKNVEGVPEVFGGTLPAKIFARTFSNYRLLKTTHHLPGPPTVQPSTAPATRATPPPSKTSAPRPSAHPTPTHRPTTPAPPPSTPAEEPSPSPSRTLFPPPTGAPPT
ncbi:MAG TPA: transglycosylase domain-containing protein [Mycobacteriales bacterium]|nr:transglycosylase domain-containing protein [Mycobacteriales bacterium]